MTAKLSVRVLLATLLLFSMAMLYSCGSDGDDNTPDPNAKRPSISGLSTNSADIGNPVDIYGLNFGDTQSSASVQLNGVDFLVNNWSDNHINVTVNAGMVSGIVVVTVKGLPSQSGTEAQLFIPAAPPSRPLINAVTPTWGYAGDEILITGTGFGTGAGGNVFFPATTVTSQTGGVVAAEIVALDVDGTLIPQWGTTSIKCIVPDEAKIGGGAIYIDVNGTRSNEQAFTVLNRVTGDAPVIEEVTPASGPIGTSVQITGQNFGHSQSGSTLELAGFAMTVASWSNTVIQAFVPEGAVTGNIRITVEGKSAEWGPFTVANTPVITGMSPSEIRIGESFTVTGKFFGTVQGTGRLSVGGTNQPISTWNNGQIVVETLAPINSTDTLIPVIVTTDSGLASEPGYVTLKSDLVVGVSVSPTAGQRHDAGGSGGTQFTFSVSVAGGSGSYEYELIPDATTGQTIAAVTTNQVTYTYPYLENAPKEKYYDTQMRVTDSVVGDSITVDGPSVLVVAFGTPVVTNLSLEDFNRGGIDSPNDECYDSLDDTYFDFSFIGGDPYFTSSKGTLLSGGNPVPSYPRNLRRFMTDGQTPRPYGYRYAGNAGGEVRVSGLNFGDNEGELWLRDGETNPLQVPSANITDWSATGITFRVPDVTQALSGTVLVKPAGSEDEARSIKPLICSPYITQLAPDPVLDNGTLTFSGFDLTTPTVTGMTGTKIYGIFIVRASYTNPFGGGNLTNTVLMTTPVPASNLSGTTLSFDIADLDIDGNGTVPVEVFNATHDESQIVEGTLQEGDYRVFLWTGALTEGSNATIANSGIFSELYEFAVSGGGGGDDPPDARLSTTPSPATSTTTPFTVQFDASASTDDNGIVKYEFNFGDGDGWEDYGTTATASHTYDHAPDWNTNAQVRVTDNATPAQTDIASVPISIGDPGGDDLNVGITVDLGDFLNTVAVTRVRIHDTADGIPTLTGSFIDQMFTAQPVDDVEQVLGFNDLAPTSGQIYISVFRVVTEWDDGVQDWTYYGPYPLPATTEVHITGFQYDEPPAPGGG
ncbi:IPT/TIG domain-containing protein [bacterium]|nr:IPT/TIG domain-containing protein [bacterium]